MSNSTCSACGTSGHRKNDKACVKNSETYIKSLIDAQLASFKAPENPFTKHQDHKVYGLAKADYDSRRKQIVDKGRLVFTLDRSRAESAGCSITTSQGGTDVKCERNQYLSWFNSTFNVATRAEKRSKGTSTSKIWQDQVKANLKIKKAYHKPAQSGSDADRYCIQIQSNKPIANYVITHRSSATSFKRCSVDFCHPYGAQSQTKLSQLKKSGIIGGWFLTAGGCNLIVTPPSLQGSQATKSKTNKPGVLLKVPDLDLFVEVSNFDAFRSFQRRAVFVDRNGKITTL